MHEDYTAQEDEFNSPGPIIPQASAGQWNTYKILEGHPWAGSGTRAEESELEGHIRSMLSTGMYPYMQMEAELMSFGYARVLIRKIFKRVTGVAVEDIEKESLLALNTPPSIPKINYGWGVSKDKKFDFYFVQPWVHGYAVFGQHGDTERAIVHETDCIGDARDWCKKHSKKYQEFNKALDMDVKPFDATDPQFNMPASSAGLSSAASAVFEYVNEFGDDEAMKLDFVRRSYVNQEISAADFRILTSALTRKAVDTSVVTPTQVDKAVADQFISAETDADKVSLVQEMREITPVEFLRNESYISGENSAQISEAVAAVEKYVREKQDALGSEYVCDISALKYRAMPVPEQLETNVPVGPDATKPIEYLRSSGIVSVLLTFHPADDPQNVLRGLINFLIIDGEYRTTGTFKSSIKERRYALDSDGVKKYFDEAVSA